MSGMGSRTPASKHKPVFEPMPSTSRSQINVEFHTPKKRSKQDVTVVKNIEDEEFPEEYNGFTFVDNIETPGRSEYYKTIEPEMENIKINTQQPKLSIIAQFDELANYYDTYGEEESELIDRFIEFAEHQELCRLEWLKTVEEVRRLQTELNSANHEITVLSYRNKSSKKILDQEKFLRRRAEEERDALEQQMMLARDLLFNEKYTTRLPDETREKLSFLQNATLRSQSSFDRNGGANNNNGARLNTITEVSSNELNSTGSLLSEFSLTRSEDGLDVSILRPEKWKRPQHVPEAGDATSPKRRRSSTHKVVEINATDKIVATTTVSVAKDGPITATSVIEALPQDENVARNVPVKELQPSAKGPTADIIESLWLKDKKTPSTATLKQSSIRRQHAFVNKPVIRPDTCGACSQRIKFGKIVLKCKECKGICHVECKNDLPLPCIPNVKTPTQKGGLGSISDYVLTLSPRVPALIIHCINEVELRGLSEIGLYRIPGSERDVKQLKEKFLKGKSAPVLNDVDVHVICGVIKDFLRSLREPLIPTALWKDFIQVADIRDIKDVPPTLYQAISQLPQPNRDTLAYMMLHLQKVAESKDCKMPIGNLSKIFGPTIIGYSTSDPEPHVMLTETRQQAIVMEHLLNIPQDFWSTYVDVNSQITTPRSKIMLSTPSTESVVRTDSRMFFTPHVAKSAQVIRKKRKFFPTPPRK